MILLSPVYSVYEEYTNNIEKGGGNAGKESAINATCWHKTTDGIDAFDAL